MEKLYGQTKISRGNTKVLMRENLSPEEIIEFLDNGAIYRSFENVLQKAYQGEDLRRDLAEKLAEITGGSRESAARNVRNWLSGENAKQPRRKQLFQICFALSLSEEQADRLLASASETGIHYRNPEELIYAYCLKKGKSWRDAEKLMEAAQDSIRQIRSGERKRAKKEADIGQVVFTRQIHEEFEEKVNTDEELLEFLQLHVDVLGELHQTAYQDYREMLKLLQNPEEGNQKINIQRVMDDFLRMYVPKNPGKEEKIAENYTYLQRMIKKSWPSEDILAKMNSREIDVSRKVMILLNLLTEEFEINDPEENEYDFYLDFLEETETVKERMEVRVIRLNLFLDKYGMNYLDPGNAFDCLVLYALRASYDSDEDTMSERMKSALKTLYPEE